MRPSVRQVARRDALRCPQQKQSTLGEGVQEALFTGAVLSFICPELSGSCVRVFEDNQGVVTLAENPLSSARSEHIDVRFHFVRELLRAKKINIQFVTSEEQHADILTNSLAATPFKSHRRFLLNLPLEGEQGVCALFDEYYV